MPTSDDDGVSENTSKRNHDKSQNDWLRTVDDAEKAMLRTMPEEALITLHHR